MPGGRPPKINTVVLVRDSDAGPVIREATRLLIMERFIEQDPQGRGFAYRSVTPFRADADPVGEA